MAAKIKLYNIYSHHPREVRPTAAESATVQNQHPVAGFEQVTDCRLPDTMSIADIQCCMALGTCKSSQIGEDTVSCFDQFPFIDIRRCLMHRI